uniref:Uncharacterized protein n=1 Tax=Plectus sambesii TaxID=2011161 RepID=A0A914WN32_9BILA
MQCGESDDLRFFVRTWAAGEKGASPTLRQSLCPDFVGSVRISRLIRQTVANRHGSPKQSTEKSAQIRAAYADDQLKRGRDGILPTFICTHCDDRRDGGFRLGAGPCSSPDRLIRTWAGVNRGATSMTLRPIGWPTKGTSTNLF